MRTQLHIQDASGVDDRARVEQVLVSEAEEFGMADTTVTSRVPDTICCFSERIGYGFATGARVVGEVVVVDLFSGKEPSVRFPPVEERITSELRRIFGGRMIVPKESEYIILRSTLPVSEASKEFHRKHYIHDSPAA